MSGFDVVHKPAHYNSHPSGVAAIEVTRHLDFDLGNVFKYVFRRDGKEPLRSLNSALWYLDDSLRNFPSLETDLRPFEAAYDRIVVHEPDAEAKNFYRVFRAFLNGRTPLTAVMARQALLRLIKQYEAQEEAL